MPTASGGLSGDVSATSNPKGYSALDGECRIVVSLCLLLLLTSAASDVDFCASACLECCAAASKSSTSLLCRAPAASSKDRAFSYWESILEEERSSSTRSLPRPAGSCQDPKT